MTSSAKFKVQRKAEEDDAGLLGGAKKKPKETVPLPPGFVRQEECTGTVTDFIPDAWIDMMDNPVPEPMGIVRSPLPEYLSASNFYRRSGTGGFKVTLQKKGRIHFQIPPLLLARCI